MNTYQKEIHKQMLEFAKDYKTIFLGQQVGVTDFYGTLKGISMKKRLEMPVAEEMQLGMSIGLALEGFLPISIFQRMDFLPRACDQLVNHLDIINELSSGLFNPKVIIRTTVGSSEPLDTGLQHKKDLTKGFRALLKNIKVFNPKTYWEIKSVYNYVRKCKESVIIVEYQDLY